MYLTHSHLSCRRCQRLHLSVKVFNGELGLFSPIPPSWVKLQSPGRNYYLLHRRLTRPQPLFCGDLLEIAWDCLRLFEIVTRLLPLSQAKVTSMQSNISRPRLRFCSTVSDSSNDTSSKISWHWVSSCIYTQFTQVRSEHVQNCCFEPWHASNTVGCLFILNCIAIWMCFTKEHISATFGAEWFGAITAD